MSNQPNAGTESERLRVINRHEAARLLGLSVPTVDRLVRAGNLPAPIQLSARRVGWQTGTLLDWLAAKETAAAAA